MPVALQLDALERAGCERTFQDTASGALKSRPELEAAWITSAPAHARGLSGSHQGPVRATWSQIDPGQGPSSSCDGQVKHALSCMER